MEKKYSYLVFDIDGTMLDTEHAILSSLKDTLHDMIHRDVPVGELKFALGIPGDVVLDRLGVHDTALAEEIWYEHMLKYRSSIRLFDGIGNLLEDLKAAGYGLGIVTSKTRKEYADDFAGPFGLSGLFGSVVCAEDAPRPKPAPDPLLACLGMANVSAGDALYIGDAVYDSQCAESAGVDFGLAAWAASSDRSIGADYVFGTPDELKNALM